MGNLCVCLMNQRQANQFGWELLREEHRASVINIGGEEYLAVLLVISPRGEIQTFSSLYFGIKVVKENLTQSNVGWNDTLQL